MQKVIPSLSDAASLILKSVNLLDEVVVVHVSFVKDEKRRVDCKASVKPIELKLVESIEIYIG